MHVPNGYFAILCREPRSKTIGVHFPDFPGVVTYGSDWTEAEEHAREALSAALESEFERGLKLPLLRKPKGKLGQKVMFIKMDHEIRLAYLLRERRNETGLTQKQMANKLDISYQAYQRMERPGKANLTIMTLEKVAKAMGHELVVELERPRFSMRTRNP